MINPLRSSSNLNLPEESRSNVSELHFSCFGGNTKNRNHGLWTSLKISAVLSRAEKDLELAGMLKDVPHLKGQKSVTI